MDRNQAREAVIVRRSGESGRLYVVLATVLSAVFLSLPGCQAERSPRATAQFDFSVHMASREPIDTWRKHEFNDPIPRPGSVIYIASDPIITVDDVMSLEDTETEQSLPGVMLRFTPEAADRLQRATAEAVGEPIVVLYNGAVIGAPVLASPIRMLMLWPDERAGSTPELIEELRSLIIQRLENS